MKIQTSMLWLVLGSVSSPLSCLPWLRQERIDSHLPEAGRE